MTNYFELEAERNNILIVDDDIFVCEMVSEHLRSNGYRTLIATSLDDAINLLSGSKIDFKLIILDYQLGSESGMELLVGDNFLVDVSRTPVIMLSSNEDPKILEESFFHGVSDYVVKPVNLTLLTLKIRIIIDSMSLKTLVIEQNKALSHYKNDAEREEAMAKFTYDYLIKSDFADFPGVSANLVPCSAFSGDVFLVKNAPNGDIHIVLADATGHGLSAAITIMPVVAAFNSMVAKGFHLERIVSEINKKLVSDTPEDRFVAAIFIEIKKEQGEIAIWNGAMPPVYLVRNGEIASVVKSQHMALGIMDDDKFDPSVTSLPINGDEAIFAFSDGFTEQKNAQGKIIPLDTIVNLIQKNQENTLNSLMEQLRNHAGELFFKDDVALCQINVAQLFSYCPLATNRHASNPQPSDFTWHLRLAGNSLSHCEPSQVANNFLQSMGVNQQSCQRVFLVMTEMVSNALEHGVLKLDSAVKSLDDGFFLYYEQRKNRLSKVTEQDWIDVMVSHKYIENSSELSLQVSDSGEGYMRDDVIDKENPLFSGRGLNLIRSLTRDLEIRPPGNFIRAVIQ
jgi:two-component system, HptB-dependent secretion and biofilm response regulator